jgi:sarcosine oxidase
VVVGVGGLGAAVVDALAQRGADVVGVERFSIPHEQGSSFGETRVIRLGYFESPRYVPVLQRAWQQWHELDAWWCAQTPAAAPLLQRTGVVHIGPLAHPGMRALLASLREHGLAYEEVNAAWLRARGFVPAPGDVGVFEEQGGFLRVEECTRALVARARELGAVVHEGERVLAIDEDGAGALRVRTATRTLPADAVVLCAGAWNGADDVTARFFAGVPLVVTRQPQLWFDASTNAAHPSGAHEQDMSPPAFLHFTASSHALGGAFYGVPPARPGGPMKVCLHAPGRRAQPDALDRVVTDDDTAAVRAYVTAHLPRLSALVDAKICMYTSTPDEHFVVGASPADARVTLGSACSGHGFKMTIALGEAAAELALGGRARLDLSLFDPRRFAVA